MPSGLSSELPCQETPSLRGTPFAYVLPVAAELLHGNVCGTCRSLEEYQGRDKDKKGLQKWENDNISSENISRLATVSSATMFKLKVYG